MAKMLRCPLSRRTTIEWSCTPGHDDLWWDWRATCVGAGSPEDAPWTRHGRVSGDFWEMWREVIGTVAYWHGALSQVKATWAEGQLKIRAGVKAKRAGRRRRLLDRKRARSRS